jgi:hypothetical protein
MRRLIAGWQGRGQPVSLRANPARHRMPDDGKIISHHFPRIIPLCRTAWPAPAWLVAPQSYCSGLARGGAASL